MLDVDRILKERNIKRSELAELMGVGRNQVSNILNNGNPSLETLQKIADALGVEIKDLFRSEKEKETLPLYVKDENGREIIIGNLDKQSGLLKDDDHS